MGEPVPVWQCIGCGRIEAPQPCIGVCQDKKVFMVPMSDHQEALEQIQKLLVQSDAMQSLLNRIVHSTPREAQWEASWCAAQAEARIVLGALD